MIFFLYDPNNDTTFINNNYKNITSMVFKKIVKRNYENNFTINTMFFTTCIFKKMKKEKEKKK